jgi:hypothetical protein
MGAKSAEPAAFRAALAAVGRVLDQSGITWWIQDGTLLGAVRHGGPIPGDKDVDIGIFASEFRPSLIRDLKAAGLAVTRTRTVDDRLRLFIRIRHNGFPVDIFGMYDEGDRWSYSVTHRRLRIDNIFTPFRIGRGRYLDLDVPCPEPAERYLVEAYGPDWRVPVPQWHCAFSPHNLSVAGGSVARLHYRYRHSAWRRRMARRRPSEPTAASAPQQGTA